MTPRPLRSLPLALASAALLAASPAAADAPERAGQRRPDAPAHGHYPRQDDAAPGQHPGAHTSHPGHGPHRHAKREARRSRSAVALEIVPEVMGGRMDFEGDALTVRNDRGSPQFLEVQRLRLSGEARDIVGVGGRIGLTFGPRRAWAHGRHRVSAGVHMYRIEPLRAGERPVLPDGVLLDEARAYGRRVEIAYGYEIAFGPRPGKLGRRKSKRPMLRLHAELFVSFDTTSVEIDVEDARFGLEGSAVYTNRSYAAGPRLGLAAHLSDQIFFDFGGFGSPFYNEYIAGFAGIGWRTR